MGNCNHVIGYWHSAIGTDFLSIADIHVEIEQASKNSMRMNKDFPDLFEAIDKKDYIDGRKGLITKFQYCPYCGEEINWKSIKEGLND